MIEGIKPHTTAVLLLPQLGPPPAKSEYLNLSFTLRHATNALPAGHEVASGQTLLPAPPCSPAVLAQISREQVSQDHAKLTQISPHALRVTTSSTTYTFSIAHGTLTSILKPVPSSSSSTPEFRELLASPPILSFYRPLTDNDVS